MGRKIGALIALTAMSTISAQAITLTLADIEVSLMATKIVDTVFVAPDSTDEVFAVYTRELYTCNEEAAKDAVELVRFENKLTELLQAVYGEEFDPFGPYEELTTVEVEAIALFEIPAYATERVEDEIDGRFWLVDLNLRHTIEDLLNILRPSP